MSETVVEEKTPTKNDLWRERLAEQERSGLTVKQYCQERGSARDECSETPMPRRYSTHMRSDSWREEAGFRESTRPGSPDRPLWMDIRLDDKAAIPSSSGSGPS
jgi:hypothetical protein